MLWQFRRELITELLARGEVVVSTPFVGREKELSGIGCRLIKTEVDRRGANPAKDYALFRKYRRIIGAEKPDAVITYSIKPNIYGGIAATQAGIPYFVNVQGARLGVQQQTSCTARNRDVPSCAKKCRYRVF